MTRPPHDNPYLDEAPAPASRAPRQDSSRTQGSRSQGSSRDGARGGRSGSQSARARSGSNGGQSRQAAAQAAPATQRAPAPAPASSGRSRRRRGRGKGEGGGRSHLTSHPTTRTAYAETRRWLLEQHGAVCAYCGRRFSADVMTLDHVAPRRGQTAYDRRDNLVLACPGCNMIKRDLAPMAFLLGNRSRAANLLRYGEHLSPMLLDMARSLAPEGTIAEAERPPERDELGWALLLEMEEDESPYKD